MTPADTCRLHDFDIGYLIVCAPMWPKCEVHSKEATGFCHVELDVIYQEYKINIMLKVEWPGCIIHSFLKGPSV